MPKNWPDREKTYNELMRIMGQKVQRTRTRFVRFLEEDNGWGQEEEEEDIRKPPLEEKMFYFQDVLRHPKDVFKTSFLLRGVS